jgi:hypothetical protein
MWALPKLLSKYVDYYNRTRTHLSLTKNPPEHRTVQRPTEGRLVEVPRVGVLAPPGQSRTIPPQSWPKCDAMHCPRKLHSLPACQRATLHPPSPSQEVAEEDISMEQSQGDEEREGPITIGKLL